MAVETQEVQFILDVDDINEEAGVELGNKDQSKVDHGNNDNVLKPNEGKNAQIVKEANVQENEDPSIVVEKESDEGKMEVSDAESNASGNYVVTVDNTIANPVTETEVVANFGSLDEVLVFMANQRPVEEYGHEEVAGGDETGAKIAVDEENTDGGVAEEDETGGEASDYEDDTGVRPSSIIPNLFSQYVFPQVISVDDIFESDSD